MCYSKRSLSTKDMQNIDNYRRHGFDLESKIGFMTESTFDQ